jgi:cell division septation protein DedD
VGRNSGPLGTTDVVAARKDTKPLVIESPAPPKASESKPENPPADTKPVETKAQQPAPSKPEPAKSAPPKQAQAKVELPKYEPVKPEPAKSKPAAPAAGAEASGGQSYLQLTATTQHEAEVYADVLKKKGFKAITSAVPDKPGLVRVLVGPIADSEINKTKSDLKAAGFPGDQAIKRQL